MNENLKKLLQSNSIVGLSSINKNKINPIIIRNKFSQDWFYSDISSRINIAVKVIDQIPYQV